MFQDTRPASLGPDQTPDAWAPFRVDNPSELTALLRQPRPPEAGRQALRRAYSAQHIAGLYLQQILHGQSA